MYFRYWGLEASPFRVGIDPRFFFESPTHEEALARMSFLAEERWRLGVLIGERGVGKSATLTMFAQRLRATGAQVALVNLLSCQADEALASCALQLGLELGRQFDAGALWRRLADRVAENRFQRVATVFLFDDADEANRGGVGAQTLAYVERLSLLDVTADARLSMLLAAKPDSVSQLGRRLLEATDLKIELEAWGESDSLQFLETSLAKSGRQTALFTRDALIALHRFAGGVPRRLKQLADLSLLAGAGQELAVIDADTVDAVFNELGVIHA